MILVAIDPGYARRGKGCACALLVNDVLIDAFFARPETLDAGTLSVCADEVLWECPQVDARTRLSVPAIVQLAAVGGTIAGMFAGACGCRAVSVSPSEWKGTTAKPVHHRRLWARLSAAEQSQLGGDVTLARIEEAQRAGGLDRWSKPGGCYYPSTWLVHNLLDAVGLGMWRTGRMA